VLLLHQPGCFEKKTTVGSGLSPYLCDSSTEDLEAVFCVTTPCIHVGV